MKIEYCYIIEKILSLIEISVFRTKQNQLIGPRTDRSIGLKMGVESIDPQIDTNQLNRAKKPIESIFSIFHFFIFIIFLIINLIESKKSIKSRSSGLIDLTIDPILKTLMKS